MADAKQYTMKLVGRIVKDGVCVGYTAVGLNGNKVDIAKDNILNYAKQGKIYNVAYRVTDGTAMIYGLNGFKVNDLPIKDISVKITLRVDIAYYRGSSIVGYLITNVVSGQSKKFDVKSTVSFMRAGKLIGITDINQLKNPTCRKVQLLTEDKESKEKLKEELLDYYTNNRDELVDLLKQYIRILEVSGTGETGEKARILYGINNIETLINAGKLNKDSLVNKMNSMKASLNDMILNKSTIVKTSLLNQLVSNLDNTLTSMSKLNMKYRKAVESDILQVKDDITELRDNKDFEAFVYKYQCIKKALVEINRKVVKLGKLQEDENAKLKLRENYINNELSKMSDNELRPIKRRIVEKTWYIRYKSLMNSNSCLQNCIVQGENGKKLRLIDIDITEKFIGKQRVGYVLKYNGKTYEYNEKLTNMSLIASFIRIANEEGLGAKKVSAKFKRDDNTELVLTI